jgi:tetratricopeptide (TPR) repeat protein
MGGAEAPLRRGHQPQQPGGALLRPRPLCAGRAALSPGAADDEKSYGAEHPEVAIGLGNLAALYRDQGRYEQAEPPYQRALAIREKVLGAEHPDVATSLSNLAELLHAPNRRSEVMRRALAILLKFTRSTGHLHPNLQPAFGNYRSLLKDRSLSQEEIFKRFAELGQEAGFDSESCGKLLERVSETGVETREGV